MKDIVSKFGAIFDKDSSNERNANIAKSMAQELFAMYRKKIDNGEIIDNAEQYLAIVPLINPSYRDRYNFNSNDKKTLNKNNFTHIHEEHPYNLALQLCMAQDREKIDMHGDLNLPLLCQIIYFMDELQQGNKKVCFYEHNNPTNSFIKFTNDGISVRQSKDRDKYKTPALEDNATLKQELIHILTKIKNMFFILIIKMKNALKTIRNPIHHYCLRMLLRYIEGKPLNFFDQHILNVANKRKTALNNFPDNMNNKQRQKQLYKTFGGSRLKFRDFQEALEQLLNKPISETPSAMLSPHHPPLHNPHNHQETVHGPSAPPFSHL